MLQKFVAFRNTSIIGGGNPLFHHLKIQTTKRSTYKVYLKRLHKTQDRGQENIFRTFCTGI